MQEVPSLFTSTRGRAAPKGPLLPLRAHVFAVLMENLINFLRCLPRSSRVSTVASAKADVSRDHFMQGSQVTPRYDCSQSSQSLGANGGKKTKSIMLPER
jgi:hypothetical protein